MNHANPVSLASLVNPVRKTAVKPDPKDAKVVKAAMAGVSAVNVSLMDVPRTVARIALNARSVKPAWMAAANPLATPSPEAKAVVSATAKVAATVPSDPNAGSASHVIR